MSPLSASSFSSPLFTLCLLDIHTCTTHTYGVGHLPHSPANKEFEKDITKRHLILCKYLVGIFFPLFLSTTTLPWFLFVPCLLEITLHLLKSLAPMYLHQTIHASSLALPDPMLASVHLHPATLLAPISGNAQRRQWHWLQIYYK